MENGLLQARVKELRNMDKYLRNHICDEGVFELWIEVVPDEPSDSDLESIAEENESYEECVHLFVECCLLDDGFSK